MAVAPAAVRIFKAIQGKPTTINAALKRDAVPLGLSEAQPTVDVKLCCPDDDCSSAGDMTWPFVAFRSHDDLRTHQKETNRRTKRAIANHVKAMHPQMWVVAGVGVSAGAANSPGPAAAATAPAAHSPGPAVPAAAGAEDGHGAAASLASSIAFYRQAAEEMKAAAAEFRAGRESLDRAAARDPDPTPVAGAKRKSVPSQPEATSTATTAAAAAATPPASADRVDRTDRAAKRQRASPPADDDNGQQPKIIANLSSDGSKLSYADASVGPGSGSEDESGDDDDDEDAGADARRAALVERVRGAYALAMQRKQKLDDAFRYGPDDVDNSENLSREDFILPWCAKAQCKDDRHALKCDGNRRRLIDEPDDGEIKPIIWSRVTIDDAAAGSWANTIAALFCPHSATYNAGVTWRVIDAAGWDILMRDTTADCYWNDDPDPPVQWIKSAAIGHCEDSVHDHRAVLIAAQPLDTAFRALCSLLARRRREAPAAAAATSDRTSPEQDLEDTIVAQLLRQALGDPDKNDEVRLCRDGIVTTILSMIACAHWRTPRLFIDPDDAAIQLKKQAACWGRESVDDSACPSESDLEDACRDAERRYVEAAALHSEEQGMTPTVARILCTALRRLLVQWHQAQSDDELNKPLLASPEHLVLAAQAVAAFFESQENKDKAPWRFRAIDRSKSLGKEVFYVPDDQPTESATELRTPVCADLMPLLIDAPRCFWRKYVHRTRADLFADDLFELVLDLGKAPTPAPVPDAAEAGAIELEVLAAASCEPEFRLDRQQRQAVEWAAQLAARISAYTDSNGWTINRNDWKAFHRVAAVAPGVHTALRRLVSCNASG